MFFKVPNEAFVSALALAGIVAGGASPSGGSPTHGNGGFERSVIARGNAIYKPKDTRGLMVYEKICGYTPYTKVTDQAAIDQDYQAMEGRFKKGQLIKARNVYERGGHSKSYARITLVDPDGPETYEAGSKVIGPRHSDGENYVEGTLSGAASWDDGLDSDGNRYQRNTTIIVQYFTSEIQEFFSDCNVGALYTFKEADLGGCFADAGSLKIVPPGEKEHQGKWFDYKYTVRGDNMNGRTLQDFSKDAEVAMRSCTSCPFFEDFGKAYDYYENRADYGDRWIMAAFHNGTTNYLHRGQDIPNVDTNFQVYHTKPALIGAIQAGILYMNVFMYVIRQMEHAVDECKELSRSARADDGSQSYLDAVHFVDEAVAYYAGSLEGKDCTGFGLLLANMADVRATQFNTTFNSTVSSVEEELVYEGQSDVNYAIFSAFTRMQQFVHDGHCNKARDEKESIVNSMKVPLIQSILRHAFLLDFQDPSFAPPREETLQSEGATYAAALAPFLHNCSVEDAEILQNNMRVGTPSDDVDFVEVKNALERNYLCLGVKCSEVGGVWNVMDGYLHGAEPCDDDRMVENKKVPKETEPEYNEDNYKNENGLSAGGVVGVLLACSLGCVLVYTLYGRYRSRKVLGNAGKDAAVVTFADFDSSDRGVNRRRRNQPDFMRSGANIAAVSEIA